MSNAATKAMRGADLVVASSFSLVARIAAEKLGLPVVSLLLSPCVFVSAEEPAHFMEIPWLPRFRRVLGARATKMVLDLGRSQSRRQTRRLTAEARAPSPMMPLGLFRSPVFSGANAMTLLLYFALGGVLARCAPS